MYAKPMVPGIVGGAAVLPVTGFYTGFVLLLAVAFVIVGAVVVRAGYLRSGVSATDGAADHPARLSPDNRVVDR